SPPASCYSCTWSRALLHCCSFSYGLLRNSSAVLHPLRPAQASPGGLTWGDLQAVSCSHQSYEKDGWPNSVSWVVRAPDRELLRGEKKIYTRVRRTLWDYEPLRASHAEIFID